eukprot:Clim_evm16s210 gene=Clim_evmTU16s210
MIRSKAKETATVDTVSKTGIDLRTPVFQGKSQQRQDVLQLIKAKGFIPDAEAVNEVDFFYDKLGIEDLFFAHENSEKIAEFILSIYGAKVLAYTKRKSTIDIELEHETEDTTIFLCNSMPGISIASGPRFEQKIDERFLDRDDGRVFRVETYRSKTHVSGESKLQLRCYFVQECTFPNGLCDPLETDLKKISSSEFLARATENTMQLYQNLINKAVNRTGPVIERFHLEDDHWRVVIAYGRGYTTGMFAALSHLYHFYGLYSTKKYVEQFANGMTIISLYVDRSEVKPGVTVNQCIIQIMKEVSYLHILPESMFFEHYYEKRLSMQECAYAFAACKFVEHFLNRLGPEFTQISELLDEKNESHQTLLLSLKTRLRSDTFGSNEIHQIVFQYPELVRSLYANFASVHHVSISMGTMGTNQLETPGMAEDQRSLSTQRLDSLADYTDADILDLIKYMTQSMREAAIFEAMLTFNQHILKTNFFQPTKIALSFRLDPSFLPPIEYPRKVYGMFFVLAAEFRGFHVRFADVARGGIRIIRSANTDVFRRNVISLFDENYNLASTQQNKNKDIPEGGSKGTVLLEMNRQGAAERAFEKYVDGLLDLLLVGKSPGIKEQIVDRLGTPEILFLGPDEGTANLMDWAALHAKKRSASFWKAFTTGKSIALGGIPHDRYGMTTRSVHQYVLGIIRKLALKEEDCTKVQTGGPDGDLGSNEILISKDKTISIVDGSGVLFDPQGIARDELERLARERKMIEHFDVSKLGPEGYRVLVDDRSIDLPDGSVVENGMRFRNGFHVNRGVESTFLVPCGGRPDSINLQNVHLMFDEETGAPRHKYIVEGANLFITQAARLQLEQKGVVLYKDASANKGGVTSSSLEVFAALALDDKTFGEHMSVKGGEEPKFYQEYVKEVQGIVEKNAAMEFECIWNEHERTGLPRCVLTDQVSVKIVELSEELSQSPLWNNAELRTVIFNEYCPQALLKLVPLDDIIERVPDSYLRAIFGSYLASRYVYRYGMTSSPFTFFEFMTEYLDRARKLAA